MAIATIAGEGTARLAVTKVIDGTRYVSCTCCTTAAECCVYPANCGRGPESVLFYGSILSGDGTTFGDTTNGVILESGVWAVYRNGVRTTRACLGMATDANGGPNPLSPLNVGANLATSYELEVVVNGTAYYRTLSFIGVVGAGYNSEALPQIEGQCLWSGDGIGQIFDEGLTLLFDPSTCRWVISNAPLNVVYAYREEDSPMGSYVDNEGPVDGWTIS
jgi:hypothetical protein